VLGQLGYGFSKAVWVGFGPLMTPEENRLQRRQWAERDAREDLRKPVEQILADLHEESISGSTNANDVPLLRTIARFGSLTGNVYLKAERQTKWVIRLTWALAILTAALLAFTIYLAEDAYLNRQRNKAEQSHATKPNHSGSEVQLTVPY